MSTRWRKFIKRFHPEGIPWPASLLYNALSGSEIFQRHYELVAHDIATYGAAESILDIGTGPGRLLIELSKEFPDAALVGMDISPAMIKQAKKNIKPLVCQNNIELHLANANDLPYADETFDLVVSTGSLHHWKDPIHAFSEMHRITKADGHVLMYDLVRKIPKAIRQEIHSRFGGFRFVLLWLHSFEEPFFSPKEMEALGRNSDFSVEGTAFVGALCCLVLRKTAGPPPLA
jgi:ubiquinone/menaquinone biosynthesis C-methylase UbiE